MQAESDGNGGIVVSKSLITIITVLILILSTCATVVAYSVGVSSTASEALNLARECTADQIKQDTQIIQNKQDVAVIDSQYQDIIRRLQSIEDKIDSK